MPSLLAWLRQPTTIAGISGLVATIAALLTAQLSWAQALPLLAGAAVSMALPDNTSARQQAEALVSQIATETSRK
jgi:hypothetical protein